MDPPESEGLFIESGETKEGKYMATINARPEVYLRCLCDDMKSVLKAYQREKRNGIDHPRWLAWTREFADWLLTQQQPGGGFPRAWHMGSGDVLYESPSSSFNAVGLLLRLYSITGDEKL